MSITVPQAENQSLFSSREAIFLSHVEDEFRAAMFEDALSPFFRRYDKPVELDSAQ
nr:hypothetical protein [Sphingobacterium gobiense]